MKNKSLKYLSGFFVLIIAGFFCFHANRIRTICSIKKIAQAEDGFGIYTMDVKYSYSLDKILKGDLTSDSDYINAMTKEVLPGIPVKVKSPKFKFGCSAFSLKLNNASFVMGRNYDFPRDTSAMIVFNHPKNGYKSISVADLNNLKVRDATNNIKTKITSLIAPFAVLDGINEKGVSIAVLMEDSPSTHQNTGKPDLPTTLAIRLVLDKAATSSEAVELLSKYDMYAVSGSDYHFYISDSTGDGLVVEYDPESPERKMKVTRTAAVTNFYEMYRDKVLPDQKNGIYGHGKERWLKIMNVLKNSGNNYTETTCWEALKASAQIPGEKPSGTQWSIIYNNTSCTMSFVQRRRWNEIYNFSINNSNN